MIHHFYFLRISGLDFWITLTSSKEVFQLILLLHGLKNTNLYIFIFTILFISYNLLLVLWNPEVQCRTHKDSSVIPILSRINPIPRIDTYFFKVSIFLPWSFQITYPALRPRVIFLNKDGFYSVRLLASRQIGKLEDHSWLALHDCLFNIFTANLHIWRPTPPSVVTGTHGWVYFI